MSSLEDEATKQGNLLRDKGDFDGAIAAYTEAICRNPQNAQPYSGRGRAYLRKGEFDKAIADCNKAIQLDPMMAEAYCCRCDSHEQERRLQQGYRRLHGGDSPRPAPSRGILHGGDSSRPAPSRGILCPRIGLWAEG